MSFEHEDRLRAIRIETKLDALARWASRFDATLSRVAQMENILMSDISDALDKAEAAAAKFDTVEAGVEAVLTTLSGQVADLAAKLAAAGVDPALVARAQALADHINANDDKLAAAIVANTPAQPTP